MINLYFLQVNANVKVYFYNFKIANIIIPYGCSSCKDGDNLLIYVVNTTLILHFL